MASQGPPPGPPLHLQPGQQPTREQIIEMQRRLQAEAQAAGMTIQEYIGKLKQKAMAEAQAQAQAQGQAQPPQQQQQQAQQNQPQPIQPGPPKPEALAVANFLKSQDLKPRTCILNGQRKDMFKGKSPPSCVALAILTDPQ